MISRSKFILFFLLLSSLMMMHKVHAMNDIYAFKSSVQKNQFDKLTHQFRCLVCQNQSLAYSNAPLAKDLRREIYDQILDNQSEKEIIHYLTDRYGDFILYRPPLNLKTVLLWAGPFIFLLGGFVGLIVMIKSKRSSEGKQTI